MEAFNFKRFTNLLMWSAQVYKKSYLTLLASLFFGFFIINIVPVLATISDGTPWNVSTLMNIAGTCTMVLFIYWTIAGSWFLAHMQNKQQRLMYMLLPATKMEKFLARYLYITVVWVIGGIVALALADLARILISGIVGITFLSYDGTDLCPSIFPHVFRELSSGVGINGTEDLSATLLATAVALYGHSIYLLGGVFFSRRQFVMTAAVQLLASMLIGTVINIFVMTTDFSFNIDNPERLFYGITAVIAVFIAVNYWLSYRLFCRIQVINNKWINI